MGHERQPLPAAEAHEGPDEHEARGEPTCPANTDISFVDSRDSHRGHGGAGESARATSSSYTWSQELQRYSKIGISHSLAGGTQGGHSAHTDRNTSVDR